MVMEIVRIRVFQVDLPLIDGSYGFADGKSVSYYDATVVSIETNQDVVGHGEVVPLGPNYLASYAEGVRSGIKELAPKLLGLDPLKIGVINAVMDFNLKGHPYVKSAIDMACWDILGKVSHLPLSTLLGGRHQDSVRLYRAIPQRPAKEMAEIVKKYKSKGYGRFQLKLGSGVVDDIDRIKQCREVLDAVDILVGDANTGWLTHDALRVAKAVQGVDVYLEQPCATFDECLIVRSKTSLPFVMDENIDDLHNILRLWKEGAADVVNIKISKFGGLTKAKQAIDLCVRLGIAMTIEDTWGGDIVTAAILHLASTVPAKFQFSSTDFNSYNTVSTGIFQGEKPELSEGKMAVPTSHGLGVEPNWPVLQDCFVFE